MVRKKFSVNFPPKEKQYDTKDPAFTRQSSPLGITPAREVRGPIREGNNTTTLVCRVFYFRKEERNKIDNSGEFDPGSG